MDLPEQVGIMVLPQTVFFPHHLLPLHIFEPRYRAMVRSALEGPRMFAIAMDPQKTDPHTRPPRVGSLGLIRSCVLQADGTSNLVLQGIARVRLDHLVQTQPYLIATPEPLDDPEEASATATVIREALHAKILEKVEKFDDPALPSLEEVKSFLQHLDDLHSFVDLLSGCFVRDPLQRQKLLEEVSLTERLRLLLNLLSQ
jgi:ATP-dependent Lon protease